MVQFGIALIVDRERARESTGQHDFGRLVGDVSPLYRIKKRKRRQTHLPPLSLLIAKRVTRFTIHGTRPGNAAGRNLRDVGGNFPASPSNPPVASYHFSPLLFRHPFVLLSLLLAPRCFMICLLRALLPAWRVLEIVLNFIVISYNLPELSHRCSFKFSLLKPT